MAMIERNDNDQPENERESLKRSTSTLRDSIRRRNEILCLGVGSRGVRSLREVGLEILDSFAFTSSLPTLAETYFSSFPSMEQAVGFLCEWATTGWRVGEEHRVGLGASLLKGIVEGGKGTREEVMGWLMRWLDGEMECAGGDEGVASRCRLFGELIFAGVFCYGSFLQRLVARGDLEGRRRDSEKSQRYLRHLADLPVGPGGPQHMMNLRRTMLYGFSHPKNPSTTGETHFLSIRTTLCALLPHMFHLDGTLIETRDAPYRDGEGDWRLGRVSRDVVARLEGLGVFWQRRVAEWCEESVVGFVVKNQAIGLNNWRNMALPGSSLLNVREYCVLVRVLEAVKGWGEILSISTWLIGKTTDRGLYCAVVDTFVRFRVVFAAMRGMRSVVECLLQKNREVRSKTGQPPDGRIVRYLNSLLDIPSCQITSAEREELEKDVVTLSTPTKPPVNIKDIPHEFPDLRDLQYDVISVASAVSNLKWHWEGNVEAMRRIFVYTVEVTRKFVASAGGKSSISIRRRIELYVSVLRDLDDRSRILPGVVAGYLKDTYLHVFTVPGTTVNVAKAELFSDSRGSEWFKDFLGCLVRSGCCDLKGFVEEFVRVVVRKCGDELGAGVVKGVHAVFYGNVVGCFAGVLGCGKADGEEAYVVEEHGMRSVVGEWLGGRSGVKGCLEVVHEVAVVGARLRERERGGGAGVGMTGTGGGGAVKPAEEARRRLVRAVEGVLEGVKRGGSGWRRVGARESVWVFEDVMRGLSESTRKGGGLAAAAPLLTASGGAGRTTKGVHKAANVPVVVQLPPCCYDLFLVLCSGVEVEVVPRTDDDVRKVLRRVLDGMNLWRGARVCVGVLILLEVVSEKVGKVTKEGGISESVLDDFVEMVFGKIVEEVGAGIGVWEVMLDRISWGVVRRMVRRMVDVLEVGDGGEVGGEEEGWVRNGGVRGIEKVVECVERCVRGVRSGRVMGGDGGEVQKVLNECAGRVVEQFGKVVEVLKIYEEMIDQPQSDEQTPNTITFVRSRLQARLHLLYAFLPHHVTAPSAQVLARRLVTLLQSPLVHEREELAEMVLDALSWVVEEFGEGEGVQGGGDVWAGVGEEKLRGDGGSGGSVRGGRDVRPIWETGRWDPWRWVGAWVSSGNRREEVKVRPGKQRDEVVVVDGPVDLRLVGAKAVKDVERLSDVVAWSGNVGDEVGCGAGLRRGIPSLTPAPTVPALTPAATVVEEGGVVGMDVDEKGKRGIEDVEGVLNGEGELVKRVKYT
ncbi:RNA polymerase II mediator complex subunit [Rhizophlyctis rosea]|nr:RNA polymerase II mediator complex subunit [Rhizophlyctis rosea]